MPYPFASLPTFGDLKQRLENDFQCTFKTKDGISFFERTVEGEVIRVVVDDEDVHGRVLLSHVGTICRRLKVNPSSFGLTLDGFPPE